MILLKKKDYDKIFFVILEVTLIILIILTLISGILLFGGKDNKSETLGNRSSINETTEEIQAADIEEKTKTINQDSITAIKRAVRYYSEEIQTSIYESYLPDEDKCLHPYGKFNKGIFDGPYGRESYYTIMSYVLDDMRDRGYSKEEYPYWVREDGVEMLGDYVIVAANIEKAPYGTIVPTSLGDGIVCDMTGLSFEEDPENRIDISTQWR